MFFRLSFLSHSWLSIFFLVHPHDSGSFYLSRVTQLSDYLSSCPSCLSFGRRNTCLSFSLSEWLHVCITFPPCPTASYLPFSLPTWICPSMYFSPCCTAYYCIYLSAYPLVLMSFYLSPCPKASCLLFSLPTWLNVFGSCLPCCTAYCLPFCLSRGGMSFCLFSCRTAVSLPFSISTCLNVFTAVCLLFFLSTWMSLPFPYVAQLPIFLSSFPRAKYRFAFLPVAQLAPPSFLHVCPYM